MQNRIQVFLAIAFIFAVIILSSCSNPTDGMPDSKVYSQLNIIHTDGSGYQVLADGGWNAIPADSSIVFINGNSKLYKVNYDGSNLTKLYPNISWDEQTLSPNGKKILLASGHSETGQYLSELYIMNTDGTNLQKLAVPTAEYAWPRISPLLDQIVFCRRGSIATIQTDGTGLDFIKTKDDSGYCSFAMFVDEDNILYFEDVSSYTSIRLFNRLTREDKFVGNNSGGFPAFSKSIIDSNLILADSGTVKIFNVHTAKTLKVGLGWGASFSTDGSQIVVYQGSDIYIMDSFGQNRRTIYSEQDSTKSIDYPMFTPDNKFIVFRSSWTVY